MSAVYQIKARGRGDSRRLHRINLPKWTPIIRRNIEKEGLSVEEVKLVKRTLNGRDEEILESRFDSVQSLY